MNETNTQGRKAGRVVCDRLRCQLGPVMDISAEGMRVLCKRTSYEVGDTLEVELSGSAQVTLPVRVAWKKKAGFWRSELGLAFLDDSPQLRSLLWNIARSGNRRRGAATATLVREQRDPAWDEMRKAMGERG